MNTQEFELNLYKNSFSGHVVRVSQGDQGGTTLKAFIYNDGEPAELDGYECYLVVLLPDKRHYYRCAATVRENVVLLTLDEKRLCCVAGYTDEAYFTFEKTGSKYSTERFAFDILRAATDGLSPEKSWDDAVIGLIEDAKNAISDADTALLSAQSAIETIQEHEDERIAAETARISSELERATAEQQRQTSELERVAHEGTREAQEEAREAAEALRRSSEDARGANEAVRADQEGERVLAEARRKSEWADMAAGSGGLRVSILAEGEHANGVPTIEGSPSTLYLMPTANMTPDDHNVYVEWMCIDGSWEIIGSTATTITPISAAQIDAVLDDGSPMGDDTLDLTGLSYVWARVKAWTNSLFAPLKHTHSASDIAEGTFGPDMLADGAVTAAKLAEGAVGAGALAAGAVTKDKIDPELTSVWDSQTRKVLQLRGSANANPSTGVTVIISVNMPNGYAFECFRQIATNTRVFALSSFTYDESNSRIEISGFWNSSTPGVANLDVEIIISHK